MRDDSSTPVRAARKPLQRASVHTGLTERIRQMVLDRELAPGERLNEVELAAEYGVSRTPLREALKVLAAEGLVELVPNRGAWVTQVTREDIEANFEVMAVLEGLAGELAAQRIGEAGLNRVRDLQSEMGRSFERKDLPAYFRANQAVHSVILEAAGNPALATAHRMVSTKVLSFRYRANLSRKRWSEALREHEVILGLLELGHSRELGAVLRAHILKKLDVVLQQFDELETTDPTARDVPSQGAKP